MTHARFAVLALILPALLLGACGGGDRDRDGRVLHRGNTAEPASLDPHLVTGTWESDILDDMIIGLYTLDASGEPIPGMAETATVSEDGLTWTFTIRDAQWSDGVPVTAHDFVFSFRRIMNPETIAQYASLLYGIRNAEAVNLGELPPEDLGVRALDDHTLVIELEYPAPYLPSLLTHQTAAPVPAHVVSELGSAWIRPGNFVGNGPYLLAEWRSNDYVRLVRNPNFYDPAPICFDEVYFYPTIDVNAAVRRVRAGELDINSRFPGQQREELERELPGYVRVHPYLTTQYFVFNTERPPFDDVRVRQALTMTLDREFIVEEITRSGQAPAYRLIPPGVDNYPSGPMPDWYPLSREERLAEARRLLEEAGFGPGNPLSFELDYRGSGNGPRIMPVVQANWREIADWVSVGISAIEVQISYENLRTGNFGVGDAGWAADYNDAQNFLYLLETRTGTMNYGRYSNPEYDALVAQSNNELDPVARGELMLRAENLMLADYPIAPLYFDASNNLVRPDLEGWIDNVSDEHPTRYLCPASAEAVR